MPGERFWQVVSAESAGASARRSTDRRSRSGCLPAVPVVAVKKMPRAATSALRGSAHAVTISTIETRGLQAGCVIYGYQKADVTIDYFSMPPERSVSLQLCAGSL